MSADKIRCFLAVPVDNSAKENILRWRNQVRQKLPNARWVRPENFHITVKFYGELYPDELNWLVNALKAPLTAFSPFELELHGIGVFPDWNRPRVLWVGVRNGLEAMRDLAGIVEAASVGLELPADKRDYHPHLTLARFRIPPQGKDIDPHILTARENSWGKFTVSEAYMIRSRLTPNGSIYTIHETFAFNGP